MQIRIVSKKIQILRSKYIPAERTPEGHLRKGTGRATQKIVASFDRWLEKPPVEVVSKLSAEEAEQLKGWMKTQKEKDREHNLKIAVDLVADYMNRAAQGIKEYGPIETKKAQRLRKACDRLTKALQPVKGKRKKKSK